MEEEKFNAQEFAESLDGLTISELQEKLDVYGDNHYPYESRESREIAILGHRKWLVETRKEQVASMDKLICSANDEDIYCAWIYTMPDQSTDSDYEWFASTDAEYADLWTVFRRLIVKKGMEY